MLTGVVIRTVEEGSILQWGADKEIVALWKHVKNRDPQTLAVGECVGFRLQKREAHCIRVLGLEDSAKVKRNLERRRENRQVRDEREERKHELREFLRNFDVDEGSPASLEEFLRERRAKRRGQH